MLTRTTNQLLAKMRLIFLAIGSSYEAFTVYIGRVLCLLRLCELVEVNFTLIRSGSLIAE